MTGDEKPILLYNRGLNVDNFGRLSDWRGWPPPYVRPKTPLLRGEATRELFTESEFQLLRLWVDAGTRQGFSTGLLYEQLEVLVRDQT